MRGGVARVVPALEGGDDDGRHGAWDGSSSGRGPSLHRTVGNQVGPPRRPPPHDPPPRCCSPSCPSPPWWRWHRRRWAHVEIEPAEAVAGATETLTFSVAYEGAATTGLVVQLPEGASVSEVPAKAGWTSRRRRGGAHGVLDRRLGRGRRHLQRGRRSSRRPRARCCSRRSSRPSRARSPGSARRRARTTAATRRPA